MPASRRVAKKRSRTSTKRKAAKKSPPKKPPPKKVSRYAKEKRFLITSVASWGTPFWRFLHTAAACYNPRSKTEVRAWRSLLTTVLIPIIPCGICRNDYSKFAKSIAPGTTKPRAVVALTSKRKLMYFLFDAHNNSKRKSEWMPKSEFRRIYARFLT